MISKKNGTKDKTITIRLSAEDYKLLKDSSRKHNNSMSDTMRWLIKEFFKTNHWTILYRLLKLQNQNMLCLEESSVRWEAYLEAQMRMTLFGADRLPASVWEIESQTQEQWDSIEDMAEKYMSVSPKRVARDKARLEKFKQQMLWVEKLIEERNNDGLIQADWSDPEDLGDGK